MHLNLLLKVGVLSSCLLISTASAQYWYGVNGPENLLIDSFKVMILYEDTVTRKSGALTGRIVSTLDEPRAVNGYGKGEMV